MKPHCPTCRCAPTKKCSAMTKATSYREVRACEKRAKPGSKFCGVNRFAELQKHRGNK